MIKERITIDCETEHDEYTLEQDCEGDFYFFSRRHSLGEDKIHVLSEEIEPLCELFKRAKELLDLQGGE